MSQANVYERGSQRGEGIDRIHVIITLPMGRPDLKEAIDRAIETTPGAVALLDGVIYTKFWTAIVYGQSQFAVEGTPLIDNRLAASTDKIPVYAVAAFNSKGELENYEELSKEAYLAQKAKIAKDAFEVPMKTIDK